MKDSPTAACVVLFIAMADTFLRGLGFSFSPLKFFFAV
jgi:hypothetical protein